MKLKTTFSGTAVLLAGLALASPAAAGDFDMAMQQLQSGKFMDAAKEFQVLVEENPQWADGYHMLGVAFLKAGKPTEAIDNLSKAIELEGGKFEYHYNLANAYQTQQKWGQVVSVLNDAEDLAPDDQMQYLVHQMRGNALAVQKKWAESIDDLEKASSYKKDSATLLQLGKAYLALGHHDKAAERLKAGLAESPGDVDSRALLAESLINLGGATDGEAEKAKYYKQALAEAEEVARKRPSSGDALYLVGRAALGAGNYPRAVEALDAAVAKDPKNCRALINLGRAHLGAKNWDKALGPLDRAIACDSKLEMAWESKGFALQQLKEYDAAIAAYERAIAIKPTSKSRLEEYIQVSRQNSATREHNADVEKEEAEQERKVREEEARLAEEARKREEWKKRQDEK